MWQQCQMINDGNNNEQMVANSDWLQCSITNKSISNKLWITKIWRVKPEKEGKTIPTASLKLKLFFANEQ